MAKPAKRGRPSLGTKAQRRVLGLRVTDALYRDIKAAAKAHNISIAGEAQRRLSSITFTVCPACNGRGHIATEPQVTIV